jgi:carbon monoxide dehydrogenase subunit G
MRAKVASERGKPPDPDGRMSASHMQHEDSRAHDDNSGDWVEVQVGTVIDCPQEAVFSFACDPCNDGRWLTNVGETEKLTPGSIGLKSRFRQFPIFLGVPVAVEWEVVEFVANRHMRGRSVAGAFAFVRGYDCEPVGSATRITKVVKLHLPLISAFIARDAADVLLRKSAGRALERLKILLERSSALDRTT